MPFEKGLLGHSDADVLAHAIADALLGAAALGDIGKLFPDSDPRYKGADSLGLLSQVCALLRERGFSICNIDATVLAQRPKLAPFIPQMRENLAKACGIAASQVSVKATHRGGPWLYRQRGGHGRPGRLPAGILNRLFGAAAGRPFSFAGHGGGPGA